MANLKERWAKRLFVRFEKDGLLAELQARTPRSCRFCCFLPHTYQVSLIRQGKNSMMLMLRLLNK